MKITILLLTTVMILSACATQRTVSYEGRTYTVMAVSATEAQEMAKAKYDVEIAKEQKRKAEEASRLKVALEEEKAQELKKKNDYVACNIEIQSSLCSKDKWNAYEFGEYFISIANKHNITPYKVVMGSSYERRNIPSALQREAYENYFKSFSHMPEECISVYSDNDNEIERVFNGFMKKWNTCYQKLK